jgi:uncharacterized glyoxalase superfamily protein PhnB
MIQSVQFTGVWVSDNDKAYDFYVDKLGFQVVQNRQLGQDFRFLLVVPPGGGTGLTVCKPMPGMPAQVGVPTTIAFMTDDMQGTYEELQAKGVKFTQPPTQAFWGGLEATFVDPDGNSFMLHQMER